MKTLICYFLLLCIYSFPAASAPLKTPCESTELKKHDTSDCSSCYIKWYGVTINNKLAVWNEFHNTTHYNTYIDRSSLKTTFKNLQPDAISFHLPTQVGVAKSAEAYYFSFPTLNKKLFKFKPNQKARLFTTKSTDMTTGESTSINNALYVNQISDKYKPNDYSIKINYQLEYVRAAPGVPPDLDEKEKLNTCVFIKHLIIK